MAAVMNVCSSERRKTDRLRLALGVAAGLPSLLWAVNGAAFIHDDWGFAAAVRFRGTWATIGELVRTSGARPLAAVWFTLTHAVLGMHPGLHALLLAALNAAVAVLLHAVLTRVWGPRLALWGTLVWIALPNRGSTRLWFAMGPGVVAVLLLLVAILLLLDDRPVPAGLVFAVGVLCYEGIVAVGVAAVLVWWWIRRPRLRLAAAALGPALLAASYIWIRSPKRSGEVGVKPFSHAGSLLASQFGIGLSGRPKVAVLTALVVLLVVTIAALRSVMQGFRPTQTDRHVLAGITLLALGAAPFLVAGFPFATDGIFDRGNLVADLGAAVLFGGVLAGLAALLPARAGVVVGTVLVVLLAGQNGVDLRDYRRAARDGERLQAQLAVDAPDVTAPMVVGPPLPNHGGVAQFIAYHDLGSALQVLRNDPSIDARIAVSAHDFVTAGEPLRYDRVARTLVQRSR